MPNPQGPLTDADLQEITRRLSELDEADRLIEQSIRGGIDMVEQQKRSRELRDQLQRIKQSFFPGR